MAKRTPHPNVDVAQVVERSVVVCARRASILALVLWVIAASSAVTARVTLPLAIALCGDRYAGNS